MPFSSHANSYSFKHSKSMLLIATTIKKNQIIISRTSNVSKLLSTICHTSKAKGTVYEIVFLPVILRMSFFVILP